MLVGVSLDQARINSKAFTTNEVGRDTGLDDALEEPAKDTTVAEPFVARSRKCRMIRDLMFYAELAKPAIGKVHLHLATQPPLGTQAKDIADDQHPDHQHQG